MRRKPYTSIGIARLKCSRNGCENKACTQWQICSDGRQYRRLCLSCDIELNEMLSKWMGFQDVAERMVRYKEEMSYIGP